MSRLNGKVTPKEEVRNIPGFAWGSEARTAAVTVYPQNMFPHDEQIVHIKDMPTLEDIQVSIFQRNSRNPVIQSFSDFLIETAKK